MLTDKDISRLTIVQLELLRRHFKGDTLKRIETELLKKYKAKAESLLDFSHLVSKQELPAPKNIDPFNIFAEAELKRKLKKVKKKKTDKS